MTPREKKIEQLLELADELLMEHREILRLVEEIEALSDEQYRQQVLADVDKERNDIFDLIHDLELMSDEQYRQEVLADTDKD